MAAPTSPGSSFPSQGSYIEHSNNTSPASYAAIEKVTSIAGPDGQAQPVDDTDLLATGRLFIGGLADFGNISLECGYMDGAEQGLLFAMYNSGATERFKLFVPRDSTRTTYQCFGFNASCSKWALGNTVNDKAKLSITLKVSGSLVDLGTVTP